MHIIYFFTYGYSLKVWKDSGQLAREIKHFEYWNKTNNDLKITLVTYGDETEIELINKNYIKVIPIYKYIKKSKYKFYNLVNSFFVSGLIKKLIKKEKDLLIIQNQLLGFWVSFLLKVKLNIPMITRTGYDMYKFSIYQNKSKLKIYLYRFLTHFSLKFSDLYTVTSNADIKFLKLKFGNKYLEKIKIRRNWSFFEDSSNFKEFSARKLNSIVCVGRLEKQKNYELIIKSLEGSEFCLEIYGAGSQKKYLSELAKKLNVKVKFNGVVDNEILLNLLENYKYFVTASIYEGNPKSVLDAMSRGCLIIASKIENHIEFLNENNSLLFNNEDSSLKDIFINLNSKQNEYLNLINNSFQTVQKFNNLDTLVKSELEDFKLLTL